MAGMMNGQSRAESTTELVKRSFPGTEGKRPLDHNVEASETPAKKRPALAATTTTTTTETTTTSGSRRNSSGTFLPQTRVQEPESSRCRRSALDELQLRCIPVPDSSNLAKYRADEHLKQALDPCMENCCYVVCDGCDRYSACCKGWAHDHHGELQWVIALCAVCNEWQPEPWDSDEDTESDSGEDCWRDLIALAIKA